MSRWKTRAASRALETEARRLEQENFLSVDERAVLDLEALRIFGIRRWARKSARKRRIQ